MHSQKRPIWITLLMSTALVALVLAVCYGLMRAYAPKSYLAPEKPFEDFNDERMLAVMTPETVRGELDAILAMGDRFLGSPGLDKVEEHIRKAYAGAGLKVIEQRKKTAAPATAAAAIADEQGRALEGVKLYPAQPNGVQPMVTPPNGLTGRLVLMTEASVAESTNLDGCIGLIDSRPGMQPKLYGAAWNKYAELGLSAVILADPEDFSRTAWSFLGAGSLRTSLPVNFVRLVATPEIFRYAGKTVRLDVRTEFRAVDNTTLIGVMKTKNPLRGALVIPVSYDCFSWLPDLAPGTLQAVPLATQLALIKGLQPYRERMRRDVVFVAMAGQMMGHDGEARLLSAIGSVYNREARKEALYKARDENVAQQERIQILWDAMQDPKFAQDSKYTEKRLKAMSGRVADELADQVNYVLDLLLLDVQEKMEEKELAYKKVKTQNVETNPDYISFRELRKEFDKAQSASGSTLVRLLREEPGYLERHQVRQSLADRLEELRAYHEECAQRIDSDLAVNRALEQYKSLVVLEPYLLPADVSAAKSAVKSKDAAAGEECTYLMPDHKDVTEQDRLLIELFRSAARRSASPAGTFAYPAGMGGDAAPRPGFSPAGAALGSAMWASMGYPAFTFGNSDRAASYADVNLPVEKPYMRDMNSMRESLRILGSGALALAFGNGAFKPTEGAGVPDFHGRVFVGNVGQSMLPRLPLKGAVVYCEVKREAAYAGPGFYPQMLLMTDPYGKYDLRGAPAGVFLADLVYSAEAVGYGPSGIVAFIKDKSLGGQGIYRSSNLSVHGGVLGDVNIVVFRAAPVTILDMINPQTLDAFTTADMVSIKGLAGFAKFNSIRPSDSSLFTMFVPRSERFYVLLKSGSLENPLIQTTRAFMLGVHSPTGGNPRIEIEGDGYRVAETPLLRDTAFEIAKSMTQVNDKRVQLLERNGMADRRTLEFHQKSINLTERSLKPQQPIRDSLLTAREACTYATLNHPIIRRSMFEAVNGILWYLGLLVPFAFFFEKLVFGCSDIRRQIAASGSVFVVSFLLLAWLHPAFQMIRSSIMILLGFVICIMALGVIVMLSGRFQENLADIRKLRGKVSEAEVNSMGVMATAFLLGLNNMHRRKVRTGLTCATLVLITFAMICFTSVRSDIVDKAVAVGKAPFQGFTVKREKFAGLNSAEIFAIRSRYAHKYGVTTRSMYVGTQDWSKKLANPQFEVFHETDQGQMSAERFSSMLLFDPEEPLAPQLGACLVTTNGWFVADPKDQTVRVGHARKGSVGTDAVDQALQRTPVLISEPMAARLGITAQDVNGSHAVVDASGSVRYNGKVTVQINGVSCVVHGIFDPARLAQVRNLDGHDLLPFDIEAIQTYEGEAGSVLAGDDSPRISPDRTVIALNGAPVSSRNTGVLRTVSVTVNLAGLSYKAAKEEIDSYLEQTARSTFYGLDGVTYFGRRTRESNLTGMIDLLIPLIIAAITVLNTMRGSVYERRDEIFVYNAVGIAPRYIFFMFFAEAFVYSVVGSVLGFIISQGTGRALTALDLTGGLNMTFTSNMTIYASLAIAASVFISTFFPARSAMAIAAPAEESGWKLPDPDGDVLRFHLPFTFNYHDRVAVLSFFRRYLDDHGEGSSSTFFSGPPTIGVSDRVDALAENMHVPMITSTIWLKPYDLGVSQQMTIEMPTDPETGEYIAEITITRFSGTMEAWLRLNYVFVTRVRQHFLHWRAVRQTERTVMFQEARKELYASGGIPFVEESAQV